MSIAELIMQGTNRASESTAWVGDSLAKLGQNVGAVLAQREQQKQAREMLPFLQQSMQESMALAGSGKTGEAYAKLIPLLTDPSVARNPFLMEVIPAFERGIKVAGDDAIRKSQIQAYKDRYAGSGSGGGGGGGGGDGGGGGLPAGPSAFFGNAGTTPVGGDVTSNAKTSLTQDEQRPIIQAAQNVTSVLFPDEVPQKDSSGFPAISTPDKWMEAQTPFEKQEGTPYQQASQNQGPIEPSPEVKKSFENNEKAYSNATPQQQQTFQNNLSSITIPQGTNVTQFDFSNIKSLRNVVGIASPVEMQIEVPESLSITENDKGKSYLTKFNKKTTNQNVIDKSNELVLKSVPNALAVISSNETLSKYFEENDLGKLDIGAKEEDGELSYYIGVRGKKDSYIPITKDDYEHAKMIRNLPASAKTLDSAFIITEEPATEAPAPAELSKEEQLKKARELLGITKPTTGKPAAKELTLEEQLAQEASSGAKTLARTATPEQLKGVEKSKISQKKSTLESEKMKLESLLYDVARATGKRTIKAGISANTKSKAEARIDEINKELEGL